MHYNIALSNMWSAFQLLNAFLHNEINSFFFRDGHVTDDVNHYVSGKYIFHGKSFFLIVG